MLALMSVAGLEEAIQQANTLRRDATTAVYTRDIGRGLRAMEGLRAGRVYVNPTPPGRGVPLPLTGFSPPSCIRRHAGAENLLHFEAWKVAVIDSLGQRP
jgi:acyl-CoA reductase-like NAD-dependent aldehyde dehydrogenase